MVQRVALVHSTIYRYARPVQLGPQWVRLRPLPDPRVPPPAYAMRIDPAPLTLHWQVDLLGNPVARMAQPGPTDRLAIEVSLEVELHPRNPFDFVLEPDAVTWPFAYAPQDQAALRPFLDPGDTGPLTTAIRAASPATHDTVPLLLALADQVQRRLTYVVRPEEGVWTPERTLAEGRGSCRDSAWLLVQLLRMHGIAARFVSGYLIQLPQDGTPDSAELHAWAEAYLPGAGWIGVDATSGLLTAEGHVALAASPDPEGATPLQGTVEPGDVRLDTGMALTRL